MPMINNAVLRAKPGLLLTPAQERVRRYSNPPREGLYAARHAAAKEWGRLNGIRPHPSREWARLLGSKELQSPPGDDHMANFIVDYHVRVHVSQPNSIARSTIDEMCQYAGVYGLTFAFLENEAGWWWPGSTLFVVWTKDGDPLMSAISAA